MKSIWVLAVVCAFVAGSLVTGVIAFADDDDDLSQLVCEAGKVMTGILFEDDDEILDVICETGSVGISSIIKSDPFTAVSLNGAHVITTMVPFSSNSACFLTQVLFDDDASVFESSPTDNHCAIFISEGNWKLSANSGDNDDDVICEATCLSWN